MAEIIKHRATRDGLSLRGRDVQFELKGKNVDPAVVSILTRQAEAIFTLSKGVAEIAQMQDKLVDLMTGMTTVAERMKQETERISRATNPEATDPTVSSFQSDERKP